MLSYMYYIVLNQVLAQHIVGIWSILPHMGAEDGFDRAIDKLKQAVNILLPDPIKHTSGKAQGTGEISPIKPLRFKHDRRPLATLNIDQIIVAAKKRGHTISSAQALMVQKEARGRIVDNIDDVLSGMGAS